MTALDQAKVLLGISDTSKDTVLSLCSEIAEQDIRSITHMSAYALVDTLLQARMIQVIYLQLGNEVVSSQSFSGVSETFIPEYPANILNVLRSYRKLKTI